MNRTNRCSLSLLALFLCLPAMGQEAPGELEAHSADQAPPPVAQQVMPMLQPAIRGNNANADLVTVDSLRRQMSFLAADDNRLNEILKRAAAVVRTRYMQIARPALPLGRLIRVPFCGGPTGRGVLVRSPVNSNSGVVALDRNSYPNYENCAFIFETYSLPDRAAHEGRTLREDSAQIDFRNQTALYADIRIKLTFDSTAGQQLPPSSLRALGQAIVRWDVELTSEPYVFQAIPNIPPPVNFLSQNDLDAIDDLRETPESIEVRNMPDRLAIARRAIEGHDGGIAQLSTVIEDNRPVTSSFDPCGETRPLKMPFMGLLTGLLEDHCYTYSARVVFGNERFEPRYLGQLRIRFQKDPRTGKIIGVRAFSFGGNI